jgi:hypothetical protein
MILRQRCLLIGQLRRTLTGECMGDHKNEEENPGHGDQEKKRESERAGQNPVR